MIEKIDNNIEIVHPDIIDENKSYCVLGVLKTSNGLHIQDEMLQWLKKEYNVYLVRQEPPGTQFEYPAIKYALDLCVNKNLRFILYLHTKGAVNQHDTTLGTRKLWEEEFTNHKKWYENTCMTNRPIVACPFSSKTGIVWLNGFFINNSACKTTVIKKNTNNRYYYEQLFRENANKNIRVSARIEGNVGESKYEKKHKELHDYLVKLGEHTTEKKKKVIYTCITGGYEAIVPPTYTQLDFDYVCFTDNLNQTTNVWELRPIPNELKDLTPVKQQRLIKICPHKYLPEYDESLWVDGAIDILSNLNGFIKQYCFDTNKSVFIRKHPSRKCIYSEAKACISIGKDTAEHINPQMNKYRNEGFPANFGLVETKLVT